MLNPITKDNSLGVLFHSPPEKFWSFLCGQWESSYEKRMEFSTEKRCQTTGSSLVIYGGGFLSHGGTPIAGWFISWKPPSRNGWCLGVPLFQETPIWLDTHYLHVGQIPVVQYRKKGPLDGRGAVNTPHHIVLGAVLRGSRVDGFFVWD